MIIVMPQAKRDKVADHLLPSQFKPTMEHKSAGNSILAAIMNDR